LILPAVEPAVFVKEDDAEEVVELVETAALVGTIVDGTVEFCDVIEINVSTKMEENSNKQTKKEDIRT
jgi:nitrogen regulatory protein PII